MATLSTVKTNKGEIVDTPFGMSSCVLLRTLSQELIRKEIKQHFDQHLPCHVPVIDYKIWKHLESGLEFASPMTPGSPEYYNWLGKHDNYYPKYRWEYDAVIAELNKLRSKPLHVADIGCGDGRFLRSLIQQGNDISATGIDCSPNAVEKARLGGIFCRVGDHRDMLSSGEISLSSYDIVTAFHCLEHVQDPLSFVSGMADMTSAKGRIFVSTPLSPMPHEAYWFDIQNYPPHHLTRWSRRSYVYLADKLNLNARFVRCPKSFGPVTAWRSANKLNVFGPHFKMARFSDRVKELTGLIRSAPRFLNYLIKWGYSQPYGFQNDILVEFTKKLK
jgi:2-polyprenyl-3-methyl-5-hydroxy-6-metoxy-1,4-benzoquinol methylase